MKKLFIFYLLSITVLPLNSQVPFSLVDGESSIVYSLPKTEFIFQVTTEKVTQKPGVFYRYCERYLATNKVITDEKTTFRLKEIKVQVKAIPDTSRTYNYSLSKKAENNHIVVDAKGLLCGVNVPCTAHISSNESNHFVPKNIPKQQTLLPLGEEYMMAGSEAKLAEGAAKQIYRIRESRLSLLTADVEKLPADGASFTSMMVGLDKMEKELTELFIGTTTVETETRKIYLIPDSALNKNVLFRFSALMGVVSKNDLSGAPYYISIKPNTIKVQPADPKAKKEMVGIYTILPASTAVSIDDGINTYYSGQFYVPQFGKIVPLAKSILEQKKIKVLIDQQTGRLLGIE